MRARGSYETARKAASFNSAMLSEPVDSCGKLEVNHAAKLQTHPLSQVNGFFPPVTRRLAVVFRPAPDGRSDSGKD